MGAVIDVALGVEPPQPTGDVRRPAAVRFVFDKGDERALAMLSDEHPETLAYMSPIERDDHAIVDSGSRRGFFIFSADDAATVEPYLPEVEDEN